MANAQFFKLFLHALISVFLTSSTSRWCCFNVCVCFLNHLKRFTKLAKDADGSVENADKLLSFGDSQSMARSSFPIGRHYR